MLVFVSHFLRKANAIGLRARIPTALTEPAIATEIVFDELALNEATFSEAAAGKGGTSKNAVLELDIYEGRDVEEAPVPFASFDYTAE